MKRTQEELSGYMVLHPVQPAEVPCKTHKSSSKMLPGLRLELGLGLGLGLEL